MASTVEQPSPLHWLQASAPAVPDPAFEVLDGPRAVEVITVLGDTVLSVQTVSRGDSLCLPPLDLSSPSPELEIGEDGCWLVLEGRWRVPLAEDDRVRIELGPLVLHARSVRPAHRLRRWSGLQARPLGWSSAGSLSLHALLLALVLLVPPQVEGYSTNPRPRARASSTPALIEGGGGGGWGRHFEAGAPGRSGADGKRGSPAARPRRAGPSTRAPSAPPPSREVARSEARRTLEAVLGRPGVLARLVGEEPAIGADATRALGSLETNALGEAYGVGGLGLSGVGRGRGMGTGGLIGVGCDSGEEAGCMGLGGLGLGGRGRGIGLGYLDAVGRGHGGGWSCEHTPSGCWGRGIGHVSRCTEEKPCGVNILTGRAEVTGSLDKELIRRTIRKHLNEVRYCYQVNLQSQPDLSGRFVLTFAIGPDGRVPSSAIKETEESLTAVGECVKQAVRRWTFPSPKGGGVVIVNYPFHVRVAGD